jgi:hypothetical protein
LRVFLKKGRGRDIILVKSLGRDDFLVKKLSRKTSSRSTDINSKFKFELSRRVEVEVEVQREGFGRPHTNEPRAPT